MKRIVLTLGALCLASLSAFAPANAQTLPPPVPQKSTYMGDNITRVYNAEDLQKSYAKLDVSMGQIWVITMPDTVTDVITSREGVMQFSKRGQRVVLGALASSGTYPMLVMTQDSVYFFQVTLRPSGGSNGSVRNIIVQPKEQEMDSSFPSSAAEPRSTSVMPSTTAQPVQASASKPTAAPTPAPVRSTPATPAPVKSIPATPTPVKSTPATPAPFTSKPATQNLSSQLELRALSSGGRMMLYYKVTNRSTSVLTFDERALRAYNKAGKPLTLMPTKTTFRVTPGKSQIGQIPVQGADAQGNLRVSWQGRSDSGGKSDIAASVSIENL